MMLWTVLAAAVLAAVAAAPGAAGPGTLEDCVTSEDAALCLKERAVRLLDSALGQPELPLVAGVSLVGPAERGARSLDEASLPADPEERDSQVESLLVDRVATFLQSRTLQLRMPEAAVEEVRRSLDEARGKKKKKLKMLLPLLMLLKMKAMALIPLALGGLALLALKALVVGKLALLLAGIIGLQKLLAGNKQSSQTYEVVAHPTYSHSHVSSYGDEHGHYGRALGSDPQQLAYAAHRPE
ncbi:uncharacterized protein LOC134534463 [Bacillus rossius redtenbacheri]|uniref:uncharacterized protein LOC134534463 n=1 Tax=Bacillus rossius redtenbacheri TaxID=93214 RepID=UPI002FDC82EB